MVRRLEIFLGLGRVSSGKTTKEKKAWIKTLVSKLQSAGGGVLLCNILFAHFEPLSTNFTSLKCHCLPEYCCWPCRSLYDHSAPIWWLLPAGRHTLSQSSNHIRLVSWKWKCYMYSTVTRSHQQSRFRMWWNRRLTSWMCSQNICIHCVMLSCQYGLVSVCTPNMFMFFQTV